MGGAFGRHCVRMREKVGVVGLEKEVVSCKIGIGVVGGLEKL